MKHERRDTTLEAQGGEFLVLGQLLIRGIPTYKAYRNMPGYDLVANWPDTNRCARIQVKSRRDTNSPGFFVRNFDSDFIIGAFLNRGTKRNPGDIQEPRFYVFPISVVRKHFRNEKLPKLVLGDVPQIDTYVNNWDLITAFLTHQSIETMDLYIESEMID